MGLYGFVDTRGHTPPLVKKGNRSGALRAIPAVTFDHLRMSSSLEFHEEYRYPLAGPAVMLFGTGDTAAFAARKPLIAIIPSRQLVVVHLGLTFTRTAGIITNSSPSSWNVFEKYSSVVSIPPLPALALCCCHTHLQRYAGGS
jgi:hypothetical protein